MPEGITQLRVGDALYISDLDDCFDYKVFPDEDEAFTLQAEIVELKNKPSHPLVQLQLMHLETRRNMKTKVFVAEL